MTIQASAQPTPIVTPNPGLALVDERGNLTNRGAIALQQMRNYIVNMCRTIPCNASTSSNTITLTLLNVQPQINQYASYDTYGFVADATTNGNVSILVVTENGALATLKAYKANGSTRAGSGDVVLDSQYFATYVDSLDGGVGGFVLR